VLDADFNPRPVDEVIEHTKRVAERYAGVAS
jgi:hypothetical protein